jgi:imidazolonepropionase-like amidohydrolase
MKSTRLLAVVGVLAAAPLHAQTGSAIAIRGGTVHTLAGDPIEGGTVVIQNGRITAVGANVQVPAGARTVDAAGLHIYPGMFDAVTRLGLTEIGAVDVTSDMRELGEFNPHLLAMTAVHPASEIIPVTRANGITHAVAAPTGRPGGIGGQGSLINLDGWTVEEMLVDESVYMVLEWPSLRGGSGFGGRRFGGGGQPFSERKEQYDQQIRGIEHWLEAARQYLQARESGAEVSRDLKLEALGRVVTGELPFLIDANTESAITDAIDFAERNQVRIIIAGASDGWKVRERLAEANIPVILGATQALPSEEDDGYDQAYANPGQLYEAGVKIAFATFNASDSRTLPYEAAMGVPYGLPHDAALRAVTINPAEMLELGDELGTIQNGKRANLIVTTGDPLEIRTQMRYVFINGELIDLENKHLMLYEKYRHR